MQVRNPAENILSFFLWFVVGILFAVGFHLLMLLVRIKFHLGIDYCNILESSLITDIACNLRNVHTENAVVIVIKIFSCSVLVTFSIIFS